MNELAQVGYATRASAPEDELIKGYRGVTRRSRDDKPRLEFCACGGWIFVEHQSDALITAALRSHQDTAEHQSWWARADWH